MDLLRRRNRLFWIVTPLLLGLVLPSLILLGVEWLVGGRSLLLALADVAARQFAAGHNLFLISVLGLLPFAALSLLSAVLARRLSPCRLNRLAGAGLAGILLVTVPAHAEVWVPLFGGGEVSSTAPLAFVVTPFAGLLGMGAGVLCGALLDCLWRRLSGGAGRRM